MTPIEHFQYCPSCGAGRAEEPATPFRCAVCGFVYYFNPTVATAAIIARPDGQVLFIERAREPARGKLAFPGGFIDIGETAEEALHRETREEVGIEISDLRLLCSHPNTYPYKGIDYPVLDFIFAARASADVAPRALDAVARVLWRNPKNVQPDDLAFPSLRQGLSLYVETIA